MPRNLLSNYLDKVLTDYTYLDCRGIMQLRMIELPLDDVFVPLDARRWGQPSLSPVGLHSFWANLTDLDESSLWALADIVGNTQPSREAFFERWSNLQRSAAAGAPTPRLLPDWPLIEKALSRLLSASACRIDAAGRGGTPVGEAIEMIDVLRDDRQCVVLGDPGSGKTTLVKWLARAYALGPQAVLDRLKFEDDLVPIVISVNDYANQCMKCDQSLLVADYVRHRWNMEEVGIGDVLAATIDEGRAFLLFDGLDEPVSHDARVQAARCIEAAMDVAADRGEDGCRCLVTSRIFGYSSRPVRHFPHWELSGFGKLQIERFVDAWCWGVEKAQHPDAPRRRVAEEDARSLREAIYTPGAVHSDSLEDFAKNPLLLTILALVHRQHGVLPELRVKLYDIAVRTLISTWNAQRSVDRQPVGLELNEAETLHLWEPVALWMHEEQPAGSAPRDEVLRRVAQHLVNTGHTEEQALATAEDYLETASRWAGILLERGPDSFGFMHQTFQEYLAARKLVREHSSLYEVLERWFFAPRWHEVLLLAAGFKGAIQEHVDVSTDFVERLRLTEDMIEPYAHRYLLLAASVVADRVPVHDYCSQAVLRDLLVVASGLCTNEAAVLDAAAEVAKTLGGAGADVLRAAADLMAQKRPKARMAALLAIGEAGAAGETVLEAALEDQDPNVRTLAAALLVRRGKVSTVTAGCLGPGVVIKGAAALDAIAWESLTKALANQEAQRALVGLLEHDDRHVRLRAASALEAAGGLTEDTQRALAGLLAHDDCDTRLRAASVLQSFGAHAHEVERAAVGALEHEDASFWPWAASVLRNAGGLTEEAQRALVGLLEQDALGVREWAASALTESRGLAETAHEALMCLLEDESVGIRFAAADRLLWDGAYTKQAQRALVGLLQHGEGHDGDRAASTLGGADSLTEEAQRALAGLLQHEDDNTRFRAASALRQAGAHTEGVQRALVGLLQHEDRQIRFRAALSLLKAEVHTEEAQRALVGLLEHEDREIRFGAASALLEAGGHTEGMQRALVGLLQHEDRQIRFRAALSLLKAEVHTEEAQRALVGLLEHEDQDTRLQAGCALREVGALTDEAQLALVGLLEHEDQDTRLRAASALLQAGTHKNEAQRALVGLLEHGDLHRRRRAASALLQAGAHKNEAQRALVGLLEHEDDDTRLQAASALSNAGGLTEEAQLALIGLLQHEDDNTRFKAASALSSAGGLTEEAQRALVGLLEHEDDDTRLQAASALEAHLAASVGERQAQPDWLNTVPPTDLDLSRERRSLHLHASPREESISSLVLHACSHQKGAAATAVERLQGLLRRPKREQIEDLLQALDDVMVLPIDAWGEDLRDTVIDAFAARLGELARRVRSGVADAVEEQVDLLGRLPDALFALTALRAERDLSNEARVAVLDRLVQRSFNPNDPAAHPVIELHAVLSDLAGSEQLSRIGAQALQAANSTDVATARAAHYCLSSIFERLGAHQRPVALMTMLIGATSSSDEQVRAAAAEAIQVAKPRMTAAERAQVDAANLPPLSQLM